MHSEFLRNSDFEISLHGQLTPFTEFANEVTESFRLGIYAPNGPDAVGAATLIMAYVTAFYDLQRLCGEDFHIYPDFFTFQSTPTLADYRMFDIWPLTKNIKISPDIKALTDIISSNRIDLLLVPFDKHNIIRPDIESSSSMNGLKNLPCIGYSITGHVEEPDLIVRCRQAVLIEWSQSVLDSLPRPDNSEIKNVTVPSREVNSNSKFIEQSFRRMTFGEFLSLRR